jgi:hypothetical protein
MMYAIFFNEGNFENKNYSTQVRLGLKNRKDILLVLTYIKHKK